MGKRNYTVDIKSAKHSAVATGHKPRAVAVTISPAAREYLQQAITESERLVKLLGDRQGAVADGQELLASATEVRTKLAKKRPKLTAVRDILEQIAQGVTGVGVLADCVARIQTLISHIPS